ncbi:GntR family transcriptional regulator [Halanaerobiaceae bacterium Z-7014]|uniref:GntR family transcriptional regulator n=1 Tax=Halonatronomonas betaini TaxID=2778430 RepID=A0A931FA16_9FIRM|nr:GntR family transcriptional regulator [Halonatronomonas betaini]MBF8436467.1 GntR family transcriptional regulator [Halonatronomonas betaini]
MNKQFKHQSLSDKVAEHLKREIFLENYQGGDHILEAKVAKELDVSRAPVREAIKELEKEGLIETIPRKGSFVASFNEEDIREVFEIRIILESRMMEIIINNDLLNEEDFNHLENLIEEMLVIVKKEIPEDEKVVELNEKDIAFHKYLWEKTNRKFTQRILKMIHNQLKLAMIIDARKEDSLEESAREHYSILENLKNKDLSGLQQSLIDHIVSYNEKLMSRKEIYPNF